MYSECECGSSNVVNGECECGSSSGIGFECVS